MIENMKVWPGAVVTKELAEYMFEQDKRIEELETLSEKRRARIIDYQSIESEAQANLRIAVDVLNEALSDQENIPSGLANEFYKALTTIGELPKKEDG